MNIPLFIFIFALTLGSASAETPLQAATNLKKSAVTKEWENCITATTQTRCEKLLSTLWEREKKVLIRLSEFARNNAINETVLADQSVACYEPLRMYNDLIICWERLANRAEKVLDGQSLSAN